MQGYHLSAAINQLSQSYLLHLSDDTVAGWAVVPQILQKVEGTDVLYRFGGLSDLKGNAHLHTRDRQELINLRNLFDLLRWQPA